MKTLNRFIKFFRILHEDISESEDLEDSLSNFQKLSDIIEPNEGSSFEYLKGSNEKEKQNGSSGEDSNEIE